VEWIEKIGVVNCTGVKKEIVLLTEQLLAAIAAGDYQTYT